MFRWIVKLIRDEYGIDEKQLVRTAVLESDLGLSLEQIEAVLEFVSDSFEIRFPDGTLDEVVRLEELCLVASWLKGLYKRPAFIGPDYETSCRSLNPGASTEV
ncbi:MAG TPA: acyl carrier protein [Aliidongia sp.]|uniref:acyl carrier protein n=1 Tax=Aliidongia sp. TaxID=1914230 RepID=UPI002DDCD837|nr:acyl carrier protein [Aliidongia sp.]HEV2677035.1 acyl carrier protein [Aliidongia sp.]